MIVSCPNCATKYNLPDEKVPAEGIKVKCSKCSHSFRATPPPATPEEEVEVLLDETGDAGHEQDQGSDFDAAFDEAVAGEEAAGEADDAADEDDFGVDDEDDDDDDFGIDDDDDDDFGLGDDDEDDAGDDSGLNLDGEDGLFSALDEDIDGGKKKGGLGKLLYTVLLLLILVVVAAIATYNMRLWSVPESMQDISIDLPFDLPFAVPFVKGMNSDTGADMSGDMNEELAETEAEVVAEQESAPPVGDPTERIKDIQPVDFNEYVIGNEVEGRLYVVEGEARNNSTVAKKNIEVEVALFAQDGTQMASKRVLCGNTLSLFQIQVDDKATIEENLSSSRGINLNNSYVKPGESVPFMVVFFGIEGDVDTFRITIVDAHDTQR